MCLSLYDLMIDCIKFTVMQLQGSHGGWWENNMSDFYIGIHGSAVVKIVCNYGSGIKSPLFNVREKNSMLTVMKLVCGNSFDL